MFAYGDNGTFPSQSGGSTNYYVDVVFQPVAQAAPVAVADSVGPAQMGTAFVISAATLLGNDTDANGDTLTISSVGGASHGTVSLNAQGTEVTFTPDAGYSGGAGFTYSISDGQGGSASAGVSLSVVPGSALPVSFFAPDATPAVPSENDSGAVKLGMQFQVSVAGTVTGIRFYKGAGNTGTQHGDAVVERRPGPRDGDLRRRERERLADRHVLEPGGRHAGPDLHRVLPHRHRPLFGHRRLFHRSEDERAR